MQIPMLRDGLRECQQLADSSETPQLAIEMAEGAPVAVWALVDLLACVISRSRQAYKGVNHQVSEIFKQSMQGVRPHAVADLLLVRMHRGHASRATFRGSAGMASRTLAHVLVPVICSEHTWKRQEQEGASKQQAPAGRFLRAVPCWAVLWSPGLPSMRIMQP